ncbi:hypothetical protein EYC80_008121 [Monilinia laxa]|uniref:Uncharacterized protein n=1 Tax=Monilinia laxa TaxID=61186 RepID=A0A5N6JU83_MONLA|nr:hypothetical protein EYC80_008121 [Monilinia laxa]
MNFRNVFHKKEKESSQSRIVKTEDIITPEGNIASKNLDAVKERKDSAGSTKSVGSISFKPKVKVGGDSDSDVETDDLASPKVKPQRNKTENIISMKKCHACSKTTLLIESPPQGCDKRLKKCLEFMEMDVNNRHVNDNSVINGPRYKILNEGRELLKEGHELLNRWKKREEAKDYVFEIRIAEFDDKNAKTRWTTNFWVPKWWDPTKDGMGYGKHKTLAWKVSQSFRKWAAHVLCSLEGNQYCSSQCRDTGAIGFFKNFGLVKDVEKMVFTMKCECKSRFPGDSGKKALSFQKWEVHLYERIRDECKREKSKNKAEDDDLTRIIGSIGGTTNLKGKNVPERIVGETKTDIPKDEIELDNNESQPLESENVPPNIEEEEEEEEEEATEVQDLKKAIRHLQLELDRKESQSAIDGDIPAANKEEVDTATEKMKTAIRILRAKLKGTNSEFLEDKDILGTDSQRNQDIDVET